MVGNVMRISFLSPPSDHLRDHPSLPLPPPSLPPSPSPRMHPVHPTRPTVRRTCAVVVHIFLPNIFFNSRFRKTTSFLLPFLFFSTYARYTYPTKIKKPMDLGTVKSNLKQGQYTTAEEFIADVRLIFTNCYTWNGRVRAEKCFPLLFFFHLRKGFINVLREGMLLAQVRMLPC